MCDIFPKVAANHPYSRRTRRTLTPPRTPLRFHQIDYLLLGMNEQFAIQVSHMGFHRLLGHVQLLADITFVAPAGQILAYLTLAHGQLVVAGYLREQGSVSPISSTLGRTYGSPSRSSVVAAQQKQSRRR